MLDGAPDWLCDAVSPISAALGWLICGDARPLCALAVDRDWRVFRAVVGERHARESHEAWPVPILRPLEL